MTKCHLALILLGACCLASAADLPSAPAAPIPPQILAAKTVFISNASDDCFIATWPADTGGCTRNSLYNEFYAALKSTGKYQISLNPQDADLILELSLRLSTGYCYKLSIVDAKTHFTLWSFFEHVEPAAVVKTQKRNHLTARTQIIADFKALAFPPENPTE